MFPNCSENNSIIFDYTYFTKNADEKLSCWSWTPSCYIHPVALRMKGHQTCRACKAMYLWPCGQRDLAGPFQVIRLCTHSKLQQIHLPSKELDFSWARALQGTAGWGDPHASLHILYQAGNVRHLQIWCSTWHMGASLSGQTLLQAKQHLLWRLVPCYDSSLRFATGPQGGNCINVSIRNRCIHTMYMHMYIYMGISGNGDP
jgi:hypothetical protein